MPLISHKDWSNADDTILKDKNAAQWAFIRGLTWAVQGGPSKHPRRTIAPSWSWLSLPGTKICYDKGPNRGIGADWRLVIANPGVDVWCREE